MLCSSASVSLLTLDVLGLSEKYHLSCLDQQKDDLPKYSNCVRALPLWAWFCLEGAEFRKRLVRINKII